MRHHPAPPGPASVLLVEDDPDIRALVRMMLERSGHFRVVAECGDGLEAVDVAFDLQPDIVLLDILMPGADGRHSLPRILARSPRSMIAVLSSLKAEDEATWLIARGAFAYFEKTEIATGFADLLLETYLEFTVALTGETVIAPSALRPVMA